MEDIIEILVNILIDYIDNINRLKIDKEIKLIF